MNRKSHPTGLRDCLDAIKPPTTAKVSDITISSGLVPSKLWMDPRFATASAAVTPPKTIPSDEMPHARREALR